MRKLSDVIGNVIHPLVKDMGATRMKIFFHWGDIVGEEIAKIAVPHKISYDSTFKSAALYLEIKNSAFGPQVHHLSPVIIEKIAVFLGYKAISEIKIKQCF